MSALILLVDDEPKIIRLARDYLEKDGFRVLSAWDGPTALATARRERPDLVILDVMLPGMDGWEVCRALRRELDIPVIMLTARSEEADQVLGLELGSDDYVTKPFSPRALSARVRAVLRRARGQHSPPSLLRLGRLEINNASHRASLDDQPLQLTPNEFKLLWVMAQAPGQVLSREQLLDAMHGTAFASFERSIDSHIKNLRRKLEASPAGKNCIETVYGVGYRFNEPLE
jgi:DNA-binding response OmpR family regulator